MTIVFCIPGNQFSREWMVAWSELLHHCHNKGIKYFLSTHYSPNIYMARNGCLGASVLRGINQKPFDGKLQYDRQIWIDSDIIVTPKDLDRLLSHNEDVVSGIYKMTNGEFATVPTMSTQFFKQFGSFEFLTEEKADSYKEGTLLQVDYTGFGFLSIKYGVVEKLKYPWFQPVFYKCGNISDFSMEDTGIQKNLIDIGIKTFVDLGLRVGHLKTKVLI